MSNGVAPDRGHILVPFDLKADVILPLERLEDALTDLNKRLSDHLNNVDTAVKERMIPVENYVHKLMVSEGKREARREKTVTAAKWAAGPVGMLIVALIGRAFGFSF